MSCRRAFDVDLVACLLDRARPEWQAFRDHYPTCADCAAEVRTWTELHGELTPAHPDPATLVRYEDDPATLHADERSAIADHLAECPGCRDEVRTLRVTDLAALVRAGQSVAGAHGDSAPPPRPTRGPRRLGRRLGAVLWSPGFAYAVVLLLLVPTLAPLRSLLSTSIPSSPVASPSVASAPRDDQAAKLDGLASLADDAQVAQLRAEPPTAAETASTFAAGAREDRQEAPVWPRLNMTPDTAHLVIAASPGLIVSLPMPGDDVTAGPTTLRIRDAAGQRALREEYFGAPTHRIALRVPSDWLRPGRYVVELLADGDRVLTKADLEVASQLDRRS